MPLKTDWEIRTVGIDQIKPFAGNPRDIDEKSLNGLTASIKRFGFVEPIVWNERTGNIVGGHQRYKVLIDLGVKEVRVIVVDLSEEDELAANITLNNPEVEGEWDEPVLELLEQVRGNDSDLFESLNFEGLKDSIERKASKQNDDKGGNKEIDVDELVDDCDTKCPCCQFQWQLDSKDVTVEDA